MGRDFYEIEKACWLGGQMFIAPDQNKLDEKVERWKPKGISLKDFKKLSFIATSDECRQKLRQYASLGVTYFMLFFGDLPKVTGMRVFAKTVVKELKTSD